MRISLFVVATVVTFVSLVIGILIARKLKRKKRFYEKMIGQQKQVF
jgi:ABC-type spermidine/putrescine transport system permease subunit II